MMAMEYMEFKDLRGVLRACKTNRIPLRIHELLYFAVQLTSACVYLSEVRIYSMINLNFC